MIIEWRALYNDGTGLVGPDTLKIDRERLCGFDVLWGPNISKLQHHVINVPVDRRLVYRRRGGASSSGRVIVDEALVALESKDRSRVKLYIFSDKGLAIQDGWGGPNHWEPKLHKEEL